jgi:hypothetical protein
MLLKHYILSMYLNFLTMKSISVLDFYLHSYLAMAIYSARTMIYCYIGYYCEKVRFTI